MDRDPESPLVVEYPGGEEVPAVAWPMLLRRNGEREWLKCGGTILGIMENVEMEEEALELRAGDLLVFYTDGISEATNSDGELYGHHEKFRDQFLHRLLVGPDHVPGSPPPDRGFDVVRLSDSFADGALQRLKRGIQTLNKEGRDRLLQSFEKVDQNFQRRLENIVQTVF